MKYYPHVCLALVMLLALAACGTPDQTGAASQPTPPAISRLSTVAPPTEPATIAPLVPTTRPNAEPASLPATATPIPPPNAPAQPCPEPLGDGASPVLSRTTQLGQPSIATTACPNPPAEQTPPNQVVVTGSTVAPGGAGTAQIIVSASTSVPGGAGTAANNNTPTPLVGGRTIGLGDQEQTLLLSAGETFELKLGSGMDWTIQIADARIVARMTGHTTDDSQGVYQALARGATVLTATGDPLCRKTKPACMMPSIVFTLNIVVQ